MARFKKFASRRKSIYFGALLLLFMVSGWMIEAPSAFAQTMSGGPAGLPHIHSNLTSLHTHVLCSGNGCTRYDPYTSGCASSFYEVAGVSTGGNLRVELEYSPLCQTNWTQVYRLDRHPGYLSGCVGRRAGSDGQAAFSCFDSSSFWWINTGMVYAPHNLASACGNDGTPFGICTAWY